MAWKTKFIQIHNRTEVNRNCGINFEIVVWQQWQQVVFSLVPCRFGAVWIFFLSHSLKKSEIILCSTENHLRQFGRCWWFRLRSHQIRCSFVAVAVVDASGDVFHCRLVRRLKLCPAQLSFGRRVTPRLSVTQCSAANNRTQLFS